MPTSTLKWTAEEVAYLRANPTLPLQDVADKLGRTRAGVAAARHRLGITRRSRGRGEVTLNGTHRSRKQQIVLEVRRSKNALSKGENAPIADVAKGRAEIWRFRKGEWTLSAFRPNLDPRRARELRGPRGVLVWRASLLIEPIVSAADPDLLSRFNRDRPDTAQPSF